MFGIDPVTLIAALIAASTPILLAAIGELVVEKAGVLNLGVEGMMILGAVAGFMVAVNTGSPWLGFVGGAAGGAILSAIFALLTQFFLSNQVATGLALTLFGLGLAALMGEAYAGISPPLTGDLFPQAMREMPVLGPIVFGHDLIIYFSVLLVAAVWYALGHTRVGLILRALGENHDAAHALGYKVILIRTYAILFGGACAGLGGAYLSLVRVPSWTEGMTAGAGWIALAIVVFASWRPWRALVGAYLFGGIAVLQLRLQAGGTPLIAVVPWLLIAVAGIILFVVLWRSARGQAVTRGAIRTAGILGLTGTAILALLALGAAVTGASIAEVMQRLDGFDVLLLSSSPYLVTIIVLVIISSDRGRAALNAPAALGKVFHASG